MVLMVMKERFKFNIILSHAYFNLGITNLNYVKGTYSRAYQIIISTAQNLQQQKIEYKTSEIIIFCVNSL